MFISPKLLNPNSCKLFANEIIWLKGRQLVGHSNLNYNYKYLHTHNLRIGNFRTIMVKMDAPLLSTSTAGNTGMNIKSKCKFALGIALISTAVAGDGKDQGKGDPMEFKLTPDAEKWQKQGVENANRDLDKFDEIAEGIKAGTPDHSKVEAQLRLLKNVIVDVANNNRQLIPKILDVIHKINGFLEADSPSFFSKAGLKALIWYVDGIRDNKSYYLLDGAQLWCTLRIKIMQDPKYKGSSDVDLLLTDLTAMQKATGDLRDELDSFAQIFVQGIKKIHSMTSDITGNLAELKKVAKELMDVSGQAPAFLDHTKELEKQAADLFAKY